MSDLLPIILPIVPCILFAKNHIFAATIYIFMIFLFYSKMTVMLLAGVHFFLIALIALSLALFIMEKKWKKQLPTAGKILIIILAVARFPLNVTYLGDIIFRFQHWGPIQNMHSDQPSLGMGVGMMLFPPIVLAIILTIALISLNIWKINKDKSDNKTMEPT